MLFEDRKIKFEERIAGLSADKQSWHEAEFRKKESDFLRARRIRISAADFRIIQVIGKGAFGTVKLVQKGGYPISISYKIAPKDHQSHSCP